MPDDRLRRFAQHVVRVSRDQGVEHAPADVEAGCGRLAAVVRETCRREGLYVPDDDMETLAGFGLWARTGYCPWPTQAAMDRLKEMLADARRRAGGE